MSTESGDRVFRKVYASPHFISARQDIMEYTLLYICLLVWLIGGFTHLSSKYWQMVSDSGISPQSIVDIDGTCGVSLVRHG